MGLWNSYESPSYGTPAWVAEANNDSREPIVFGDSTLLGQPTIGWTDDDGGETLSIVVYNSLSRMVAHGSRAAIEQLRDFVKSLYGTTDDIFNAVFHGISDGSCERADGTLKTWSTWEMTPICKHWMEKGNMIHGLYWEWEVTSGPRGGFWMPRAESEVPISLEWGNFRDVIDNVFGRDYDGKTLVRHQSCPVYVKLLADRAAKTAS